MVAAARPLSAPAGQGGNVLCFIGHVPAFDLPKVERGFVVCWRNCASAQ